MIALEPKEVKLVLMSNEIEAIRDELERVPYNVYKFIGYEKIITKLNRALEDNIPQTNQSVQQGRGDVLTNDSKHIAGESSEVKTGDKMSKKELGRRRQAAIAGFNPYSDAFKDVPSTLYEHDELNSQHLRINPDRGGEPKPCVAGNKSDNGSPAGVEDTISVPEVVCKCGHNNLEHVGGKGSCDTGSCYCLEFVPQDGKGCGKWVKFWNRYCGQMEDLKHSDHIILCDKCREQHVHAPKEDKK